MGVLDLIHLSWLFNTLDYAGLSIRRSRKKHKNLKKLIIRFAVCPPWVSVAVTTELGEDLLQFTIWTQPAVVGLSQG